MRFKLALVTASLLATSVLSKADTISIFNLAGVTTTGSTLSGTVTLNVTTGRFTDSSIKALYNGTTYTYSGAPISTTSGTGYSSIDFAGTGATALYDFDLILPTASLIGYTGGALCSTSSTCGGRVSAVEVTLTGSDTAQVTSGTLTPAAAVTPEPSGLVLLGTGVLATTTLLRKRYAA